jgi:hypothetical protein
MCAPYGDVFSNHLSVHVLISVAFSLADSLGLCFGV